MSENMINYNPGDIDTLITDSGKISASMQEINSSINNSYSAIDSRVQRRYADIFDDLNRTNAALADEVADVDGYSSWLQDTLNSFYATDTAVQGIANTDTSTKLDSSITGEAIGLTGVVRGEQYSLDPTVLDNLPSGEKEVIKQKLKELGYTEDEIESIFNGEVSVDKFTLDKLSSTLEKVAGENTDVRTQLKDLYGFDLFNEDGSVNKDKLALAMIIDSKDPNDEYDLQNFLKQFALSGLEGGSGVAPNVTGNVDTHVSDLDSLFNVLDSDSKGANGNITSLTATGLSSGANSSGASSLLKSLGSDDDNFSNSGVSSNVVSFGSTDKIAPEILDSKKSGVSGVAVVAGAGSALATAGGGFAITNNKAINKSGVSKDEEEDEEESEEEEKTKEKEDKKDEDKKNSKEWLYGLGIGLGGLALLHDDDDEDKDKKDGEEEPY